MTRKIFIALLLCLVVPFTASADSLRASCSNGIFEGVLSDDVISWKGIPYAKAPVGSLRWKAPQAPDASTELIKADKFAEIPLQAVPSTSPEYYMAQGEDCLHLNIWKVSSDSQALKPVMVWIHGGAFRDGAAPSPYYDGQSFVKNNQDVIYVNVDFRLGLMGFIDFANSGLAGAEEFTQSGNVGLLDILQAAKWINENIASFGGDPDNITLFGQSSGSASISLIMSMEESAGLFKRAITESGAISMTSSKEDCAELTQKLIELTGATSMNDLINLSSQDLLAATAELLPYLNFPERDGVVLSENPAVSFGTNSGNFDLLLGTNANEVNYWITAVGGLENFSNFVNIAYSQIIGGISAYSESDAENAESFVELRSGDLGEMWARVEFFNDLLFRGPAITQADLHYASSLAGVRAKTYMYYWEYPSTVAGLGACHAAELPYVLNSHVYPLAQPLNQELADKIQSLWVNFAKTGDPATDSISWPSYNSVERRTLIIGENIEIENAPLNEQRELIEPLLKYGISGRELINSAYSQQQEEPNEPGEQEDPGEQENPGEQQEPEEQETQNSLGSSGGGCNTGALFIPAVIYFFIKKRRV
ncbi:MAG: carboxylesterase/lipase family protein [Synergistaceae bacterium]|nr:carboxylesterase/lipase family protein [Synergistaceae bacterium]